MATIRERMRARNIDTGFIDEDVRALLDRTEALVEANEKLREENEEHRSTVSVAYRTIQTIGEHLGIKKAKIGFADVLEEVKPKKLNLDLPEGWNQNTPNGPWEGD